jgi:HD superfamily phosphodiesterase
MTERCEICGCKIHRNGEYAKPTIPGRSHATKHHHVAERFFGRSKNRPGTTREAIFNRCPWGAEGSTSVFCYECHEELIHNPVLLESDIRILANLVKATGFAEDEKSEDRNKIAGRIKLLHRVIETGLKEMTEQLLPGDG